MLNKKVSIGRRNEQRFCWYAVLDLFHIEFDILASIDRHLCSEDLKSSNNNARVEEYMLLSSGGQSHCHSDGSCWWCYLQMTHQKQHSWESNENYFYDLLAITSFPNYQRILNSFKCARSKLLPDIFKCRTEPKISLKLPVSFTGGLFSL